MSHFALSVLIPAAGDSGRLGQAKQQVKYKGKTLLQNAVDVSLSIRPDEIIVVTGARFKALKKMLQATAVRCIHNAHWRRGMGSSIALGAGAISPEATGLMILLCDQWRIGTQDLQVLLSTWQTDSTRIVVAQAQDRYMPPVIFPASCFEQLRALEGERGAHGVLEAHPELLTPVPMKNAVFDLDTKSQLDTFNPDYS